MPRSWIAPLLLALTGCFDPGEVSDPTRDGGSDAGGPTSDAGADAGFDAGPSIATFGVGTLGGAATFPVRMVALDYNRRSDGGVDHANAAIFFVDQDLSSSRCAPDGGGLYQGIGGGREFIGLALGADGGEVGAGTYSLGTLASRSYVLWGEPLPDGGTSFTSSASGTATLLTLTPSQALGFFEAQFEQDDGGTFAVSGAFDAPLCAY